MSSWALPPVHLRLGAVGVLTSPAVGLSDSLLPSSHHRGRGTVEDAELGRLPANPAHTLTSSSVSGKLLLLLLMIAHASRDHWEVSPDTRVLRTPAVTRKPCGLAL